MFRENYLEVRRFFFFFPCWSKEVLIQTITSVHVRRVSADLKAANRDDCIFRQLSELHV